MPGGIRRGVTVPCTYCKKLIYRLPKDAKTARPCCSFKCYGLVQRKRVLVKCETCTQTFEAVPSVLKWASLRGTQKRFCSIECRSKGSRGENSYQWISDRAKLKSHSRDRSNDSLNRKWRSAVFERDHFTCVICRRIGGYLEAHHIIRYSISPERRLDVSNGVTLCVECHQAIKNREEQFQSYFLAVLASIQKQ